MKPSRLLLFLIPAIALVWGISTCNSKHTHAYSGKQWHQLQGSVFHTFYHITYEGTEDYLPNIEILFNEFDGSLSMFNDTSIISRMNQNDPNVVANDYFREVFEKGMHVSKRTNGAFDMTVAPLVNLWGFGFKNADNVSPQDVDSILQFVGYGSVTLDEEGHLHKSDPRTLLDASSIAKGYMSDIIAEFLASKGVENYMVEIGGEIALHGYNPRQKPWTVGISRPVPDTDALAGEYQAYMHLTAGGVATSGNYRNFYEKEGKRYGHTIDPHTGYPIQRDVISATVVASDCMTADAYATSFMVMGSDFALQVMAEEPGIEGYLILPAGPDGKDLQVVYSEGFTQYLSE
ncbi:MAG: FAD:protein FMN transferase [Bacteroidales bacterium]|nr:FAD:protein FMN transferase [Bacteroidales bacterium]